MGCCQSSELSETAGQGRPLKNGEQAPAIVLTNIDSSIIDVVAHTKSEGNNYAVVCFYRGGWCPFCNGEIKKFTKKAAEIKAAGGSLFFLSPSALSEQAALSKDKLPFPTLQDVGNLVGKKFGIVHKAPGLAMIHNLSKHNASVDATTGEEKKGDEELPLPCAFIIRVSDNSVVWSFGADKAGGIGSKLGIPGRPDPNDIIGELKALKSGQARSVDASSKSKGSSDTSDVLPGIIEASKVVVISSRNCPYCSKAKALLEQKMARGKPPEEISLLGEYKVVTLDDLPDAESSAVTDSLAQKFDHETVPAIFINKEFIGGFSELEAKNESGELDKLLGA